MKKFELIRTGRTDYPYNVQVWESVDGGKNYYYSGRGTFCRDLKEAKAYKAVQEKQEGGGQP